MDRSHPFIRSAPVCLLGVLLGCLGAGAQPEPQPRPLPQKSLRIINRTPVPQGLSVPTDIRWASDDSVYVSWYLDGVKEVGLDGAKRREAVPSTKVLQQLDKYSQLAVSPDRLAVAAIGWHLTWRLRQPAVKGEILFHQERIDMTHDLDLSGDRLLILGVRRAGKPIAPDGAIAFIGTLAPGLKDLRPVLFDEGGPGVPHLYNCRVPEKGAARFLADGSFVIVPGFQKGVHLFNAKGEQVRSWTSAQLGLDTDCSGISAEEEVKLRTVPEEQVRWFNSHHIVDDILPLPQGPGLLVRSMGEDGRVHWVLKVLTPSRILTYAVPLAGSRPADRLHGDVRGGRIVLLLSAAVTSYSTKPEDRPGEIVLAEIPN